MSSYSAYRIIRVSVVSGMDSKDKYTEYLHKVDLGWLGAAKMR